MPILPLVDLLILGATANLALGFILKSIDVTTHYSPTLLGFSSMDFVVIAMVCVGLALALAARTWVKLNEHRLLGLRGRYYPEAPAENGAPGEWPSRGNGGGVEATEYRDYRLTGSDDRR